MSMRGPLYDVRNRIVTESPSYSLYKAKNFKGVASVPQFWAVEGKYCPRFHILRLI